ncbi:MAG: hypothetical protein JWN66_4352 [Sphingomonas bacterium]|uniref:DUF6491 family protein n=1 Tax=Sphingomonas bacterium TaxID=1895847 RepID=UPI002635BFDE|nr:DUF6491 family protein [Sphingomonas bacterium]MDB5707236.1 hypothetical protein [Sphingomonas bacterium]
MSYRSLLALPLLMFGTAAIAQKAPPPPGTPASIPFVDHDGIYDFQPDGDHAVYLQDRSRKWYHATLMGPCLGLSFATRIGVKTSGTSSLDKFGSLLVDRDECRIDELVTSGPPPKKVKKPKHKG